MTGTLKWNAKSVLNSPNDGGKVKRNKTKRVKMETNHERVDLNPNIKIIALNENNLNKLIIRQIVQTDKKPKTQLNAASKKLTSNTCR